MEGLKAEGLRWGLLGDSKGVQNRESILCMLPIATAQLLQASITFTNTYINTLHTIVGLGGRLPTEAQLTVMSQNSRKGARLPEMCSMCSLLPKSPPFPSQGLVCPVRRVAVGGFGDLRLGLQGAGLAALTRATRGILR